MGNPKYIQKAPLLCYLLNIKWSWQNSSDKNHALFPLNNGVEKCEGFLYFLFSVRTWGVPATSIFNMKISSIFLLLHLLRAQIALSQKYRPLTKNLSLTRKCLQLLPKPVLVASALQVLNVSPFGFPSSGLVVFINELTISVRCVMRQTYKDMFGMNRSRILY